MAVLVRTCCCGCDLRTGILLIGFFGLLTSGYGIYSSYGSYKTLKDIDEGRSTLQKLPVAHKYFKAVINLSLATIAFRAISTLANLLLLTSYGTLNRYLALPWFFWELLMLVYTFALTAFFITIWEGFAIIFVINVIGWLLTIYFIVVVYSYIENLRLEPEAPAGPPQIVIPIQTPAQMQPATQMHPPPYGYVQEPYPVSKKQFP